MTDLPPSAAIDRTERSGSPWLVVLLALLFVAAAGLPSFLPPELGSRVTVGLLAVLAIAGVVSLFAYAVGFLQLSGHSSRNDVTQQLTDTTNDGLLLVEGEQRGAVERFTEVEGHIRAEVSLIDESDAAEREIRQIGGGIERPCSQ